MKVSIFETYQSVGKEVDLTYVIERVRKGGKFSQTIDRIRELKKVDPDAAQDVKKTLPGVTFSGIFKHRKSEKLIRSTGMAILDFDKVEDLPAMRAQLMADDFAHLVFVSPSGNGLKMVIRIPDVKDDKEFKSYFYALQNRYPEADPSGKDVSRFCFISHDPDIFHNPESKTWTEKIEQGTKGTKDIPAVTQVRTDFKKLAVAVQMIDKAEVGNRNNTILKAGRLAGGYIASGELNELDVLDICGRAIYNKEPRDERENFNTFRRGIEHGKREPLTSSEEAQIQTEVKFDKLEYTIEEAYDLLDHMYDNGISRGYLAGWAHFDDYYSVKPGYTTYIYGSPFAGKSKWWFNVLVNLSIRYGLRHLVYSPETGSKEDVYALLIQIHAKGDVSNTFGNQISREKFNESKTFIGKHFIVISTDETDTDISPSDLLNYVDVVENKYKTKIDTVTIDPWNELKHEDEQSRDLYLNTQLKKVRVNARKKSRHICLITHIRDQKPVGYDDLGTAIYPFPTPHDVAGGQVWYRKGFMMLSFYRHFIPDGHDQVKIGKDRFFNKNQLLIRVQKFKPEGTGKRGEIEFTYHPKMHVFSGPNFDFSQPSKNFYEKEDEDITVPF